MKYANELTRFRSRPRLISRRNGRQLMPLSRRSDRSPPPRLLSRFNWNNVGASPSHLPAHALPFVPPTGVLYPRNPSLRDIAREVRDVMKFNLYGGKERRSLIISGCIIDLMRQKSHRGETRPGVRLCDAVINRSR